MQNQGQEYYSRERRLYEPKNNQKYYGCTKEDKNNSDMSIDFSDSDQLYGPNLNLPLQTDGEEMRELQANFNLHFRSDQNLDFGNCSTQSSSSVSSKTFGRKKDSTATCCTSNKFSAKFAAPVKQPNRAHFKSLLKNFDRKEFSGKSFMERLNRCDKEESSSNILPEEDEEMSLESHLEKLSKQYIASSKRRSTQSENSSGEDLQMKIQPKSYFDKGYKIVLQSKKRYYQKVRKDSTHISISFPASLNHCDLKKNLSVFKAKRGDTQTCYQFFKNFSEEFCDKGLNLTIKVNDEPVFPAKMTLDYLTNLYEKSKASVIIV